MRSALIVFVLLAAPLAAHAQVVFPAETAYRPLRCGNMVMTDPYDDVATARDERDVIGDAAAPAAMRAADDTNLYLRMRLDEDPAPNGQVRPFSWGMAFDLDVDANDYELLILVEGIAGMAGSVQVFQNSMTTTPNDPTDPANQPPVQTSAFADSARSVVAPATSVGGTPDFFLDFAVPWSVLEPLGLGRDTPTRVWVASSSSPNSLDGDFACHAGGSGAPTLTGTASDPTTGDPNDPGAGGGIGELEGGGGCAVGARGGLGVSNASWVLALALAALARRRRKHVRTRT